MRETSTRHYSAVCQYEVLKYLSFAVSTLAKCAKIIPVMVWGRIILHKRYSASDFVGACAVTAGCFIFVLDRGALRSYRGHGVTADQLMTADHLVHQAGAFAPAEAPPPVPAPGESWGSGHSKTFSLEHFDRMMTHSRLWFESVKPHSELHQYILGTIIMLVYLAFDGGAVSVETTRHACDPRVRVHS